MNCTLIKKKKTKQNKSGSLLKNYALISLTLDVYNELEIVHL